MSGTGFFGDTAPIRYEGPQSANPLAYRHYDRDKLVLGKRMEDHLRAAVCYWHSFVASGLDMFGGATLARPWFAADDMAHARLKADVAFEMFDILGLPFFTFHDRDIAPEGASLAESNRNVREIADVFAYAAAQVKNAIDVTHRLGGANYVLWGGREGYETLLNTDLKRELAQLGRFLEMVVEYKHKIGFKGVILIEPKPQEPTKHQYDFDVGNVYGFLAANGLANEVKVNIEVGHAVLAHHAFEHEVSLAAALGILGSVDANRNDYQSGWDTDQFPNNAPELALALHAILKFGGLGAGGFNFDAKIRRQSLEPADLLYGHIGGMDTLARALTAAAAMIEDGALDRFVAERYAGWDRGEGAELLAGRRGLADLAARVERDNLDPQPRSGRQEYLENLVNRYL